MPETAPKWLGKYGKILYPKLATYLNNNSKIIRADQYLAEAYCSAYDIYRTAYADLQEHGIQQAIFKTSLSPLDGSVVNKDFQGYRKNPAYQMMSDSLSKMNQIGRELGLSPRARSQMMELNTPSDENKKSVTDQMKEFFR